MRRLTTIATAASLALALGSIALAQSGGSGGSSGSGGSPGSGGATTSPGAPRSGGAAAPQGGAGSAGSGSTQQPAGSATVPSTSTTPRTGSAPQTGTQAGPDQNAHWRRLSEDWKSHAGEVRKEWPQLTDADVNAINGRRSELISRLQTRYRISAAEADRQVSRFEQRQR